MIVSTGQFNLSLKRGYLVNIFSGIQGLNFLQVCTGVRVTKLVSILIILGFIVHVLI